jgi:hypothetical protein
MAGGGVQRIKRLWSKMEQENRSLKERLSFSREKTPAENLDAS